MTDSTQFRNDNTRTEEQIAVFGEISFAVTDALTVAIGARYYDLDYGFTGYGAWRYGNRPLFIDDNDPTNDIYPARTGGRDYGVQNRRDRAAEYLRHYHAVHCLLATRGLRYASVCDLVRRLSTTWI